MSILPYTLLVTALSSFSSLLGTKSVHTEVFISAPPEKVWSVLMTLEDYSKWNSVFTPISGDLKEEATMTYMVHESDDKPVKMSATVKKIVPLKLLNQTGGICGVLTFDHRYQLEPEEDGTRVIIHENYTGFWVNFWDPSKMAKQYEKLALELKDYVDTIDNEI